MGGREVGAMANLLPGHRVGMTPHRAESRACGASTRCRSPGLTAVECSRPRRRRASRRCGSPAPTRRSRCPTRPGAARAGPGLFVVVQEAFATAAPATTPTAAAGRHLGREGRHGHQQRAPDQPRARCRAAAGEARLAHRAFDIGPPARGAAAPRPAACSASRRRAGLARAPPPPRGTRPRHLRV